MGKILGARVYLFAHCFKIYGGSKFCHNLEIILFIYFLIYRSDIGS